MDTQAWGLLAIVLLTSAKADRYDQGSQKFYLSSSSSPEPQNNEIKEVVIYLTPRQIKAFKSNGAVVKFQSDAEAQSSFGFQQQIIEERSAEQVQENILLQQSELANFGQQNEDGFKIKQTPYVVKLEEKNTVQPREISFQFKNRSGCQQEEKYVASLQEQQHQIDYSYIPNQQSERIQVRRFIPKQQESIENKDDKGESQTEAVRSIDSSESQEWVEEENTKSKETSDKLNTLLSNHEKFVKAIGQHLYKLVENEFQVQNLLRDLKKSPNFNDHEYALQVEKRRSNLDKENYKGPFVKSLPVLSKEEIIKKPYEKVPAFIPFLAQAPKPFEGNVPQRTASALSSVILKVSDPEKTEEKPKTEKYVPNTKNIFFKLDNPYFEEHVIPYEIKKELPIQRPENLPIVRHLWEH